MKFKTTRQDQDSRMTQMELAKRDREKYNKFEHAVEQQVDKLVHQTLTHHVCGWNDRPGKFFATVVNRVKTRLIAHAKAMKERGQFRWYNFEIDLDLGTFYCCPERSSTTRVVKLPSKEIQKPQQLVKSQLEKGETKVTPVSRPAALTKPKPKSKKPKVVCLPRAIPCVTQKLLTLGGNSVWVLVRAA